MGDKNLSVRDADVIASVENKVTGAAAFTSCMELGCDRGQAEGHWISTESVWSLFGLARNIQIAKFGSALHTGTQKEEPDLKGCTRTWEGHILLAGDGNPDTHHWTG